MKKLEAVLSESSIDNLIEELDEYYKGLESKTVRFSNKLADEGIRIAKENAGQYVNYIEFTKDVAESTGDEVTQSFKAFDTQTVHKEWIVFGGNGVTEHFSDYSGLYMAEFGSGAYVDDTKHEHSVGVKRGDMSKYGQAYKDKWYWVDKGTGEVLSGDGEQPTYPVYNAYLGMKKAVGQIAKEIYGEK